MERIAFQEASFAAYASGGAGAAIEWIGSSAFMDRNKILNFRRVIPIAKTTWDKRARMSSAFSSGNMDNKLAQLNGTVTIPTLSHASISSLSLVWIDQQ